ncbi:autotransporter assembly complex family protein [soil metagenome]
MKRCHWRAGLIGFAGFILSLSGKAHAEYRVEIEAEAPVRALLAEHLDLVRYKARNDISDEQFKFLVDTVAEQVTQLASTEGYFTPVTKVDIKQAGSSELKVVHVRVDSGKRTVVSNANVEVIGPVNEQAPERAVQLKKRWRMTPGRPFRQADWDDAKDTALNGLQQQTYAAARITQSEARIEPDLQEAQLAVEIDSGPKFTLGALKISGTKRYPPRIIENVNPLQAGEPYDVQRLLELQRQIQRLPYFGNVIVGIDDDPAHAEMTPVKVQVSEVPTQRIRAGVGYASDTGAHVEGRYSHYNLFDRAWVFDSQLKIEQQRQFGSLKLDMPPDQYGYINGGSTSYERTTLSGIDLRSFRLGVKHARNREKYDLAYGLDFYLDELKQIENTPLPPNTVATPGKHRALVPSFAWTRRDVDDPIFPRSGNIISAQAGFGVKGLLTDQTFVRGYARMRQYFPVGRRDVVILRGEVGAALTGGSSADIPASLLFRAGGNDSIRGYGYQSIGNLQNGTVFPTRFLASGSAEYQHWLTHQWGGAVFYDAGTATDNWTDKIIYHGVGVGARWRSPVGTLNVDLAYGVQAKQIRPHISLGIAF